MKIKTIIIFVIFLLFLPSISFSESQPPPPRPAKTSENPQGHANSTQKNTNDIKEISEQRPLHIYLDTNTKQPHKATSKKEDKSSNKSPSNWWLIIFTCTLAICAIIQVVVMIRQNRSIAKQINIANESIRLTNKAFISANRPRLRIRNIIFGGFIQNDIGPTWIHISNVGGSEAKDINLFAVFALKNEGFRIEPWTENLPNSIWYGKNILAPGEEATYELRSKPDVMPSIMEIGFNRQVLSIIGKIRYRDANDTERETSFGWTYETKDREFSKPEKEDQNNYED